MKFAIRMNRVMWITVVTMAAGMVIVLTGAIVGKAAPVLGASIYLLGVGIFMGAAVGQTGNWPWPFGLGAVAFLAAMAMAAVYVVAAGAPPTWGDALWDPMTTALFAAMCGAAITAYLIGREQKKFTATGDAEPA